MKKAALVVSDFFKNNRIFEINNPQVNRDDCLYSFYELKLGLAAAGYDLATSDIHTPAEAELVIYNEMPAQLPPIAQREKSFLLLFESTLIRPDNWIPEYHQRFNKVFTWNDDIVDGVSYHKINFTHRFPETINTQLARKTSLCTLIAGNKKVSHELELYSRRYEAIRWFEKHQPQHFDFYGVGWDRFYFSGPKLFRALNRIKPLGKLLAPRLNSYKGVVDSKREVLEQYRYAICYENARDIPGYITEKIFDCFFAGCVPVYWGANNISDHIPSQCFIDKRNFSSYAELYAFLSTMSDDDYQGYLANIEAFLFGGEAEPFRSRQFARTVVETVLNAR